MKELPKDIEVGLKMLNGIYTFSFPKNYGKVYIRTNEALSKYFQAFPIKGSSILTVAGSGDHVLQAAFMGARKIEAFDKNRFQIYLSKLKVTALKVLNQEDFACYFGFKDPSLIFDLKIYLKIRDYLDLDSVIFWDTMYQKGNLEINKSRMFFLQYFVDDKAGCFAFDDNYYTTKANLENVDINLHHATFHDFIVRYKDDLFDTIFMSNITDYLTDEQFENLNDFLEEDVSKHLNDDGKVVVYVPPHKKEIEITRYTKPDEIAENSSKVYVYKKNNTFI